MAATLRWTREAGEGWGTAWQVSGKSRDAFVRDCMASHLRPTPPLAGRSFIIPRGF